VLDPLIHEWPPQRAIVRCHDVRFAATEFNRTASEGRFRPVRSRGRIIGTIYAAQDDAGAIAESGFRPVPVGAAVKQVSRARLAPAMITTLVSRRELRLASLHGHGLRRVGATRAQLIDCEADHQMLDVASAGLEVRRLHQRARPFFGRTAAHALEHRRAAGGEARLASVFCLAI
jgi:hypothetical protein